MFAESNDPSVDAALGAVFEQLRTDGAQVRVVADRWGDGSVQHSFRIVGPETIVLTERYLVTLSGSISR